ncbi:MAG: glutathione S-transferase [Rhodoferax sp.]|nr:glutathione S-transferase [Rhodoferax sp.]
MPLTLFGSRGSGSAAVEMALRAASVEYQLVRASSWEADSAFSQLLELNPLGQIPTLRLEDGTILTESVAILLYLGLEHPASGLLPTTSVARALDIRGLVYIAANCYSAVSVSDFPEQWTTASTKPAQTKVREAARAQLHRKWDVFFDVFGTRLRPSEPGALDFLAVVVSQWSGTRQHLKAERPSFYETLLQLEAHPRLASTLREHRAV